MTRFIKNNKLSIIFLIIIVVVIVNATINYKNEFSNRINLYNYICDKIVNDPENSIEEQKIVKDIGCDSDIRLSIMGNYRQAFDHNMTVLFDYGIPIMITILVATYFGTKFRTGYFKNELTRDNYKNIMKKNLLNSYKLSLIVPLTGLIIMISFSFISNIHAVSELYGFYDSDALAIPEFYINKVYLYYSLFVFNLFLYGLYISNIYLIVIRKIKNIITSVITSYLVTNVLNIFLSNALGVGVAYLLYYVFKYNEADLLIDYFNPQMVWRINFLKQPLFLTLTLLILVIISFLIILKIYGNKEKVIIESEK